MYEIYICGLFCCCYYYAIYFSCFHVVRWAESYEWTNKAFPVNHNAHWTCYRTGPLVTSKLVLAKEQLYSEFGRVFRLENDKLLKKQILIKTSDGAFAWFYKIYEIYIH